MTDHEERQLRELLKKGGYTAALPMPEEGALTPIADLEDQDWSTCDVVEYESMNDASKRRLAEAEAGHDGYGKTKVKQLPVPLTKPPASHIPLPEGVSSMEAWGRTLMEQGKLARLKLSYAEI